MKHTNESALGHLKIGTRKLEFGSPVLMFDKSLQKMSEMKNVSGVEMREHVL